jgi:hypothetical protein
MFFPTVITRVPHGVVLQLLYRRQYDGTVELNDDLLHLSPSGTVNITLNSGQTYAFRSLSTLANRHINGIRVTSNNNIAVTVWDDALQKERVVGGTSWDLFGDQIVPLDIVGTEYIVMKGFMVDAPEDGGERICITATESNIMIYIDNNRACRHH